MLVETLRVFSDLAKTGSFSKAAELNYITQSAVSQQVKNLERTFKCALVGRSKGVLRLTPAGLILYKNARRILGTYTLMLQQLEVLSSDVGEGLRIDTVYSVGTYVVQEYVRNFLKKNPNIQVDVAYQQPGDIYENILRNRADLGILAYPSRRRGLEFLPLQAEEMVLVCRTDHGFASEERLEITRLNGQDFVAFGSRSPTRKAIHRVLADNGVRVCVRMMLDNIETIKSAVQTGTGISIVPEPAIRNELRDGSLHVARFKDVRIERPLCAVIKRGKRSNKAVQLFLEHLRSQSRSGS